MCLVCSLNFYLMLYKRRVQHLLWCIIPPSVSNPMAIIVRFKVMVVVENESSVKGSTPQTPKDRYSIYLPANPTSPSIQTHQKHFSDFTPLLRHLTVGFYLSDARPGERFWEARPPALTYVPELQEWGSEKAQRINLRLLQLSRHTLLYLFNHTCLWTIYKKKKELNREHAHVHTHTHTVPCLTQL